MKNYHKSDFRKSCIKRLEFTSLFLKYYKNKIIVRELKKFIERSGSKNILLYIPLGIEVDVRPLIVSLRKSRNKSVYVPYMQGDSFKIVKYNHLIISMINILYLKYESKNFSEPVEKVKIGGNEVKDSWRRCEIYPKFSKKLYLLSLIFISNMFF